MNDIAAAAGVSKGTLYVYFQDKEHLFVALIERVRSEQDRRRVGLALTAEGEALLRRVRARRTTWLADRLRGLSDEDVAALSAAIEPLARLL